jgi:hypothetical protein
VLYSDGVTEAHGGVDGRQPLGEERLAEILAGCDVLPAPGIAERVTQRATGWLADGHHDDIAVLVVQAPLPVRPPARPATRRHLHSVGDRPAAPQRSVSQRAVPQRAAPDRSGPPTRACEETQ